MHKIDLSTHPAEYSFEDVVYESIKKDMMKSVMTIVRTKKYSALYNGHVDSGTSQRLKRRYHALGWSKVSINSLGEGDKTVTLFEFLQ